MVELIASILFIGSTAGVVAIAAKKMPDADQLPEKSDLKVLGAFGALKKWLTFKIKSNPKLKDISWMDLAQKALIKGRVVVLKTENKLNEYMLKLRQRAESQQKEKEALLDDYWHDLKTMVKTKKIVAGKNPKAEAETIVATDLAGENEAVERITVSETPAEDAGVKTVYPENAAQKQHKKKRHSGSKKKFRDPFSW